MPWLLGAYRRLRVKQLGTELVTANSHSRRQALKVACQCDELIPNMEIGVWRGRGLGMPKSFCQAMKTQHFLASVGDVAGGTLTTLHCDEQPAFI